MKIIIIAAMAANRVIGRENTIPWHLPQELDFFKKTTMGHPLIMGRKTHESIGRPLPGRRNIVLSSSEKIFPGCERAASLEEGLVSCKNEEKVFIVGGAKVYELGLKIADTMILTILDREVEGDTYFPDFPLQSFRESWRNKVETKEESYTTICYERNDF